MEMIFQMPRLFPRLIATGFGTGYSPAPGTAGAAAAALLYWLLPVEGASWLAAAIVAAGFFIGVWATASLVTPAKADPQRATWDEWVGVWVACLALPKTWPYIMGAFVLFRFFDIAKPWPIRKFERLPRGWGIMTDDLAAGIAANLVLQAVRLIGG